MTSVTLNLLYPGWRTRCSGNANVPDSPRPLAAIVAARFHLAALN